MCANKEYYATTVFVMKKKFFSAENIYLLIDWFYMFLIPAYPWCPQKNFLQKW